MIARPGDRLTPSNHPTSRAIETTIRSDPAEIAGVRHGIEAFAARAGLDERGVAEVGLCVNEALANVIRHAYGGARDRPIVVGAHCQDRSVVVTIRDWGNGVDPSTLPPKPRDVLEPGGLGLVCLSRLMSGVTFYPQGDGMLLVMTKRLPDADARAENLERGHE